MADPTYVTFVLDETGSMQSIKDDTIGGFNAYLEALKQNENPIRFSLLKFDSNRVEKVCVDMPIADVPWLTAKTYQPGAATPLIDACYKAIVATNKKLVGEGKHKVAITIQTDGYENASTEHSLAELAALVKQKTAEGWLFTFLGAGIDAFDQAEQFGIGADTTLFYGRGRTAQGFASAARSHMAFSKTGLASDAAFTLEERQASGGNTPQPRRSVLRNLAAVVSGKRRARDKAVDDFTL